MATSFKPSSPNHTTPSKRMLSLCGGTNHGGVSLTHDEVKHLKRVYEVHPEEHPMLEAGALRNVLRAAEHDGMRIMAWLSGFLEPGEDPLKFVVQVAIEAGLEVDPVDVSWVQGELNE